MKIHATLFVVSRRANISFGIFMRYFAVVVFVAAAAASSFDLLLIFSKRTTALLFSILSETPHFHLLLTALLACPQHFYFALSFIIFLLTSI